MSIASEIQRIHGNIEDTYTMIGEGYPDVLPAEENSDSLSDTVSSALSSAYQEGYHSRDDEVEGLEADVSTLEGYIDDTIAVVENAGYGADSDRSHLPTKVGTALTAAYAAGGSAAQQTISNLQSQISNLTNEKTRLLVNTLAANIGENKPPYQNDLTNLQSFLDGKNFLNNAKAVDTGEYNGTIAALAIITFTGYGTVLRPLMFYTEGTTYILKDTDCSVSICQGAYFDASAQLRAALANLRVTGIADSAIKLYTAVPLTKYALSTKVDFDLLSELSKLSTGGLTQEHAISGTFVSNSAGHDMEFSGTITLCKLRDTE